MHLYLDSIGHENTSGVFGSLRLAKIYLSRYSLVVTKVDDADALIVNRGPHYIIQYNKQICLA